MASSIILVPPFGYSQAIFIGVPSPLTTAKDKGLTWNKGREEQGHTPQNPLNLVNIK